jgi:hypothetical protein
MKRRLGRQALLVTALLLSSGCSPGETGRGDAPTPAADEFEEQTLEEPERQLESPPPGTRAAARGRRASQRLSDEIRGCGWRDQ